LIAASGLYLCELEMISNVEAAHTRLYHVSLGRWTSLRHPRTTLAILPRWPFGRDVCGH